MLSSGRRFDRATALFLSLIAVAFIVATFDVRSDGDGAGTVMREGAQTLFTPLQKGVDFVAAPFIGFVDGVANIAGLRDDNERLRERLVELEEQLRETTALERQVAELEAINGLEPPEQLASVTARIYSAGASAFDQIRYIDKGIADGIVVGQAVIDERGLVGRIDQVTNSTARVRLITDPLVSVGVRVQESNETGVVTGQGTGMLRLEMFEATEPVVAGNTVITDGSRFPPGIAVGTVTKTADAQVTFALRTDASPAVELSKLDYVKVIVGWSPLDAVRDETDTTVEIPIELPEGSGL